TSWPAADPARLDRALIAETDVVQRVVGLGRAARNSSKLKVRQPLARILVRVPDEAASAAVRRHEDQILDELNVKNLELLARDAQDARKQAGLEVSDRIELIVEGDERVGAALRVHRDYLMSETLASKWRAPPAATAFVARQDEGDARWVIRLARDPDAP